MAAVRAAEGPLKMPAAAEGATGALLHSPLHGEWVDVPMPGGEAPLRTWVVYPERADRAPVVLVIHEIFGLTDWVRAATKCNSSALKDQCSRNSSFCQCHFTCEFPIADRQIK
jgi:hypothetical protein